MPPVFGSAAPKCLRCNKSVYSNEERKACGGSFHRQCFVCKDCNKSLDSTTCAEHEKEVYCKACYGKNYGPKGYGYNSGGAFMHTEGRKEDVPVVSEQTGAAVPDVNVREDVVAESCVKPQKTTSATSASFGGAPKCPRCTKSVYAAELILGPNGTSWHKMCYTCPDCGSMLDSSKVAFNNNDIYCKADYAKRFGPKGYGFAGGAAIMHTDGGVAATASHPTSDE